MLISFILIMSNKSCVRHFKRPEMRKRIRTDFRWQNDSLSPVKAVSHIHDKRVETEICVPLVTSHSHISNALILMKTKEEK